MLFMIIQLSRADCESEVPREALCFVLCLQSKLNLTITALFVIRSVSWEFSQSTTFTCESHFSKLHIIWLECWLKGGNTEHQSERFSNISVGSGQLNHVKVTFCIINTILDWVDTVLVENMYHCVPCFLSFSTSRG